jgi:GNAT superfamily N-acetyltransferase
MNINVKLMNKIPKTLIEDETSLELQILREIYFKIRIEEFFWENKNEIKLNDFDNSTKDELILIAYINDNIVGFISIWEKEFRRFGVGKALLNKTIEYRGKPLTLKCVKDNEKSVKFYLSQNWKIEEEVNSPNGNYYLMKYY